MSMNGNEHETTSVTMTDTQIIRLVEDHLDELAFGTFEPGVGTTTEDGKIIVDAKTVTGQMGRFEPTLKFTTFMRVSGVRVTLDMYMHFESSDAMTPDDGRWVIEAHQVKVIDDAAD